MSAAPPQRHQSVARDAGPSLAPAVGPLDEDGADGGGRAEPEMRPHIARGQVAAVSSHAAPERGMSGALDANPGADPEPVAGLVEADLQPVVPGDSLVEQQPHRTVVVGDDDVHVAVVVDIAECGAAADLRAREGRAREG